MFQGERAQLTVISLQAYSPLKCKVTDQLEKAETFKGSYVPWKVCKTCSSVVIWTLTRQVTNNTKYNIKFCNIKLVPNE